jgi:hypothetical protein
MCMMSTDEYHTRYQAVHTTYSLLWLCMIITCIRWWDYTYLSRALHAPHHAWPAHVHYAALSNAVLSVAHLEV